MMPWTARFWENHSLTVVLAAIGALTIAFAWLFEDKWWDFFSGLGQGTLTGALVFYLSRFFRETAKPEDPPE
jgi:uncharacterized membrane protein YjjP (DUF1212 family)